MRILLVGASGFIGSALARALLCDGHEVTGLARDLDFARRILPELRWAHGDLRDFTRAADWAGLLEGQEIVVNASGALQTGLRDNVGRVQDEAIVALAMAARESSAAHVIQISAAGADPGANNDFMASKARADAAVSERCSGYTVLRPGLVIGRNAYGGTELLRAAAGMPLLQIDIAGTEPNQCIALVDVVEAVRRVVAAPADHVGTFDLVEAAPRGLPEIIAAHRAWLGVAPARVRLFVPAGLLWCLTLLADALGWLGWRSPLHSNAVAVLSRGVAGDAGQTRALLGREPLSLRETLAAMGGAGKADRWHARLALLYPLALGALVLLWLASGIIGLFRTGEAAQVLVSGGIGEDLARAGTIGGSLADIAIAAGILFRPALGLALKASVVLATAYCLGALTIRPDLWIDPLAPMLKVAPAIVLSLACLAMAGER